MRRPSPVLVSRSSLSPAADRETGFHRYQPLVEAHVRDPDHGAFALEHEGDIAALSDFRYFVDRHFEDGCNLVDLPCDQRHRALGAVLGWHAAEVDLRVNDIGLWFRPTNAGYFGYLNELTTPSTTSQQVWTMFRLGRAAYPG